MCRQHADEQQALRHQLATALEYAGKAALLRAEHAAMIRRCHQMGAECNRMRAASSALLEETASKLQSVTAASDACIARHKQRIEDLEGTLKVFLHNSPFELLIPGSD